MKFNKLCRDISVLLLFLPLFLLAQQQKEFVQGIVNGKTENNEIVPLVGANIYWTGTYNGVTTDINGRFKIERNENARLVVSYVGYQNDTIYAIGKNDIQVLLNNTLSIEEVNVVYRRKSTQISMLDPIKTEMIGEKELLKAACCNLSESFETNPSVDVSFTDAVTGTRQIQMLGLSGPNIQITRENIPDIRGLSAIYGLTFIPGTWIESIQLNKGTGSVANGYESLAGQINIELRKPEEADRLYLNLYSNEEGRAEANLNLAHRFNEGKFSTGLLLHGSNNNVKSDRNGDGFLDHPLGNTYTFLNRWKYIGENGLMAQLGFKTTYQSNKGGQVDYNSYNDIKTLNNWGMGMKIERNDVWAKIGKVFIDKPWKTMGLQMTYGNHRQDGFFGNRNYDAMQNSYYINYLYQGILGNTNHKFRTGASLQYDNFEEEFNSVNYNREEIVPGAYFEYTYNNPVGFDMVAGLRGDYHNIFGFFATPRLHLRYAITEKSVFRASAGRGQRTPSIISENIGYLAGSRQFVIRGNDPDRPYGLNPEIAWNTGLNFTQKFKLDYREGAIGFDFYHTFFTSQVVVDLDHSPGEVVFYNLDGESYSNSFQAQLDYEVIKRLDMRLAYRWYDVKSTYDGELRQKPLLASDRAFVNLAYHTRKYWKFDFTTNWQGEKRIPNTMSNPVEFQLPQKSPGFVIMNAQISKSWNEKFELYAGAENILSYKQKHPIVDSEHPFGDYFDSSMIWGPIFGRNIYMGLRYKLK